MATFETYTCGECGDEFRAHPSGRAAQNRYCSPRCESAGEGLA